MIKKFLLGLLGVILLIFSVVIVKTLTFSSTQPEFGHVKVPVVPALAVDRFQESITFKTISFSDRGKIDTTEFLRFHEFLTNSYPAVDSILDKQLFNYSLLYKWTGSDPSLDAVVLMGHMDVVPVDESTLGEWEAEPFSGDRVGNKIIGRGTMDDKINVMALMETANMLIAEGFRPSRTIYFSFGHDEEIGGDYGAKLIAAHLKSQGAKIAFALDEGGFIAEGMIPGITVPVAVINTGEKGYASFELTINTPGGHSSQPPVDNTIGSLATAITKLEANQFEYKMLPILEKQIEKIGPHFPDFIKKMAFANPWLFGGAILEGLNAHTTIAPTMISGGVKDNVIPTEASAVINFRILPGESIEDIKKHIIKTVQDGRVKVETIGHTTEPSTMSSHESESYQTIEQTIIELFPEIVVSPGLLGAGTDSKHFIGVAENVYRFYPSRINPENVTGFHGNNEYCTVENYKEIIQFNYQLLKNLNK